MGTNKERILEKHFPSMNLLFLDDAGRAFRERIHDAMDEYAKLKIGELKAAYDKVYSEHGRLVTEIENRSSKEASLKKKAQVLVDALDSIAHAPVPANEREYISWFVTAKNVAGGATSQWDAANEVFTWNQDKECEV